MAPVNGTVNVQAGTFVGQVQITKDLTLLGQSEAGTVIQSPATLTQSFTTSSGNVITPVVYVHNADGVTIQNLTVDGNDQGNGNDGFDGIAYYQAGGTMNAVQVENVEDSSLDGNPTYGIYADADNGTARSLEVTGSNVHDFQKNGITVGGADLTVNINENTVTGAGPTSAIAQNGIQIGSGAQGIIGSLTAVDGNSVSGIDYTGGGSYVATSILSVGAGASVTIENNIVTGAQMGIYVDTPATILANTITGGGSGDFRHRRSQRHRCQQLRHRTEHHQQRRRWDPGGQFRLDRGSRHGFREQGHGRQHKRRHCRLRAGNGRRQYGHRSVGLQQRHHCFGRGRADRNRHEQQACRFRQ